MEQATNNGSGSGSDFISAPIAGDRRDWSSLPEELLVSVLQEVHVADAIRSGAVCTSWHAAYAAFRRLRVPSPRQPPCLLYASNAVAPGAAAVHCPATGATLRILFPLAPLTRRLLLGSGYGWLVTADEASNLHLVNPVTGAQVALPPITALYHVERGTDEDGKPAYLMYEDFGEYNCSKSQFEVDKKPTILEVDCAHEFVYNRVVLSASPCAGRACVVLLLHMPNGEASFARLGDERWTWVGGPGDDNDPLPLMYGYRDAIYSAADGLFYLLRLDASMYSLDLNGPSPLKRKVLNSLPKSVNHTKYLVKTPAGDILQVWRTKNCIDSATPVEFPPDYVKDDETNPFAELITIEMQLYKVDLHGQRANLIKSLPDYALFLGFNASMCLHVKDFPGLKPNCAYMTEDDLDFLCYYKFNRREIGIWSMAEKSMSKLADVSPTTYPWLNWPPPIWIQPSLL